MLDRILDRLLSRGSTILIVIGIVVFALGAAGEIPFLGGLPLSDPDSQSTVSLLGLGLLIAGVAWLWVDERHPSSARQGQAEAPHTNNPRGPRNLVLSSNARAIIQQKIAMLGDLSDSYRLAALTDMARSLPSNITGAEAEALLGNLSGSYRQDAIKLLGPKLSRILSASDAERILADLWGSYREEAIRSLHLRN